ncbi:hypothetical protein [Pontibacter amylolyticus]|uniref:DUF4468 domain-containing protein n=1 Tax=Pontibacter amylolyticus TaxID=1424080 RepID=A0ABQ1W592_9BACT|nr:hypothetical protein [Pontibacter amylolyticus]GGG12774.1 hypothetical protein GCM10011323_16510 [Pontibacter amylolyticus]
MNLKFTLILIIFLKFSTAFSQEKISVAIVGSDTYIETYSKSYYNSELSLDKAYRLGPGALSTLKQGIKKAIEWSTLNETHQKGFEKEICRFKVMKKELYKFHGYVDGFTSEMTLLFKGYEDGSFDLVIRPYNSSFDKFIEFNDKGMVKKFNNLLHGKSANKEIDDIFN